MSDISDFMADRPTLKPPVEIVRDPPMESFREETSVRAARTPAASERRSGFKLDVSQTPCRAGQCRHPPGTLCGNVDYVPDPSLDEIDVGWTPQHIPGDRDRWKVPIRCILCGTEGAHDCAVLGILQTSS